jgi:endonuclease/exonuclease/phosphatase family metal-dependent hydrolase
MSTPSLPRAGDLRVATLNLWGGYYPIEGPGIGRMRPGERHPAWAARQQALAAGLRELGPDLVAFQEALKTDDHGPSLETLSCSRTFDRPVDGVWASDHFGVVADLAVPAPTPTVAS